MLFWYKETTLFSLFNVYFFLALFVLSAALIVLLGIRGNHIVTMVQAVLVISTNGLTLGVQEFYNSLTGDSIRYKSHQHVTIGTVARGSYSSD